MVFFKKTITPGLGLIILLIISAFSLVAKADSEYDKLLEKYISSKGYNGIIIFNSSNIKRYWVDVDVVSNGDQIEIASLSGLSIPLNVSLINVDATLDCKIDVISNEQDLSFIVSDSKSQKLSESRFEEKFIDDYIYSTSFHLEDTLNNSFFITFFSNKKIIPIKTIVLSFSKNKESTYLSSPGSIKLSKENIYLSRADVISYTPSIAIKSKQGTILINKKIFVTGNEIQTFARIKNIGETPTSILMGFSAVTKEHVKLDHRNFPFKKTNKVIKVVSSKQGSDQIIVDSFTEWTKGCLLAINAQDDLSDLPNNSFVEGAIKEIKQTSDGQAIITLDKPLSKALQKGDKLRVHGCPGSYFYTNKEKLLPGHEISLSSKSIKDDTVLDFSSTAFPKGTFYVVPLLLSYSVNPDTENTIVISDYSIAY